VRLAPTNGLAYARLARRILEEDRKMNPRVSAEAAFYSRYAAQLAPKNPEVRRIRDDIQANVQAGPLKQ